MPIILVLTLINIVLIVHAAKTGRFSPWGYIILMLPGIGAIAYVVAELIPAWFGNHQGQQARKSVGRALDPDKQYRALKDEIERADTIVNREALAEECLARGRFREAEQHYDVILARPMGDEPRYVLGKARAAFGDGAGRRDGCDCSISFASAGRISNGPMAICSTPARLRTPAGWPRPRMNTRTYRPIIPARNPASGSAWRCAGSAARSTPRETLADVVKRLELAPPYVRKTQAEWLAMARQALKI